MKYKKNQITLFGRSICLVLLFSFAQLAIAQQHEIKLGILSLIGGEAKIYYEYHISDRWSAEVGIGHQKRKLHLFPLEDNLVVRHPNNFKHHEFGFDFTLKYYLSKKIPNTGLYIGPRFSLYQYRWIHPNIERVQSLFSFTEENFKKDRYGGVLGLKIPVFKRFLLEVEGSLLLSRNTSQIMNGGQIKVIYRLGKSRNR